MALDLIYCILDPQRKAIHLDHKNKGHYLYNELDHDIFDSEKQRNLFVKKNIDSYEHYH